MAWAERTGVEATVITKRLDQGWAAERAVSEPARPMAPRLVVEVDGVPTAASEVSRSLGSSRQLVAGRVRKGWDPAKVATTPPQRGQRFDLDGQMLTLVELSRLCGLARRTIFCRIRRGMSVREAISVPRAAGGVGVVRGSSVAA